MPPLAFTHLKNAAADRGAELKSMPPLAVVSARILIGLPVAGFPLPIPHFAAEGDSFPTSESLLFPDDPPQAESAATNASASAAASAARRYLVILHLLQEERRSIGWACGRRSCECHPDALHFRVQVDRL